MLWKKVCILLRRMTLWKNMINVFFIKDAISWASDHDQTFLNLFHPCQHNIRRIFFDTWDIMFGDMEEYFSSCSWMNDIYDEKKWIFVMNIGNICFFVENWTKETWWKLFKLVYFKTFDTWNVQVTLQVILHISLIWNIFKLYNI